MKEPVLLGVDTYELLAGLDPDDYDVKEREDQVDDNASEEQ